MKFLIISGLSGAGKSRAADALEDLDYYCVDNLPTALLTKFAELCLAMGGRYERVALVTDVRGQESFTELFEELNKLGQMGIDYQILYMEAAEAAIVQRYKESRRPHPLIGECGTIREAVIREAELLRPVRDRANHIINTTNLSLNMLQQLLLDFFGEGEKKRARPILNVISFGFKHGIPQEADMVFDVRFLPNPFYMEKLRQLNGMDAPVQEYVLRSDVAKDFLRHMFDMVDFLLPQYAAEGRYALNLALGCTGGQHRSVAVANALYEHLKAQGEDTRLINRDCTDRKYT